MQNSLAKTGVLVDINHLIRMHEWPWKQANLHKQISFVLGLRTVQK